MSDQRSVIHVCGGGYGHFVVMQERIESLEAALRKCASHAGHYDAAEGCRLVIATARDALESDE